eukprot:m.113561 g.113561  ORF g.113561 m.113561 type:complete len:135 (+) comp16006_c0_seq3:3-407(+)
MIEEDLARVCVICSLQSYEFERFAKGFTHHITKEHNIFNYLWFLMYLSTKDETEFTSHELFFHRKMLANDLSVFPIHRAMSLASHKENDLTNQLKDLQSKMADLVARAKKIDLERQLEEEKQRVRQREQDIKGR